MPTSSTFFFYEDIGVFSSKILVFKYKNMLPTSSNNIELSFISTNIYMIKGNNLPNPNTMMVGI